MKAESSNLDEAEPNVVLADVFVLLAEEGRRRNAKQVPFLGQPLCRNRGKCSFLKHLVKLQGGFHLMIHVLYVPIRDIVSKIIYTMKTTQVPSNKQLMGMLLPRAKVFTKVDKYYIDNARLDCHLDTN